MTELTVADVLERAADLIEPEGAWTQGAAHRDKAGRELGLRSRHPNAVCWCIGGALHYVTKKPVPGSMAEEVLNRLLGGSFVRWNDAPERTQAEVVTALREAAALAREQRK